MEDQRTIMGVAALAASGTYLLARQLQARRMSMPARVMHQTLDQARRRPATLGTLAVLAIGGVMLSRRMQQARGAGTASSVQDWVEVDVPVRTAYDQWTQF